MNPHINTYNLQKDTDLQKYAYGISKYIYTYTYIYTYNYTYVESSLYIILTHPT